jgi:uncharacterized protein YciI
MFVLIARYTRPIEEVDQLLDGHRAWIVGHMEAGRILLTARQVPLTGGLILARANSLDEVWAMIGEDPFHSSGSAEYDVWEFDPVRAAPGLEGLLEPG